MSSFTKPAILEMLDHYRWRVVEPFEFYSNQILYLREQTIKVPTGFITDLASVPRILWTIFPPHGRYAKAAIIHDYLYSQSLLTKAVADKVFLEGMKVLGVPKWRRTLMYWAVHIGGRGAY